MGRFFGRRPDPTPAITRALRNDYLDPGEEMIAGVYLQRPGANTAALGGAGNAGVSATTGVYAASSGSKEEDRKWLEWGAAAGKLPGVDPVVVKRTIFLTLALTDTRLLLVRRSRLLRFLHREIVAAWPLIDIDRIEVAGNSHRLCIVRGGTDLVFELPQSMKFLAPVYKELPALFTKAKQTASR